MTFPNRAVTKLTGHNGPVHCVRFSAGVGQYVLTGSADRAIHLYNPGKASPTTPKSGLIQVYSAHGYEVLDVAVADDNARFASVGGDKQVFYWDVATARTLRRWTGHLGRVNTVGFGGEGGSLVVSGSFDATVRIWDCKSQSTKPIQILEESGDSVSSLDVLGHEIVTGSVDGTVRLYDLRMGKIYADVIGQAITSVQQTRDSHAVLVSTLDSTIRLMDKANGQRLQSYKGHMNNDYRIRSTLAFADSVVISGSEDGQIYAWDLLSGDVVERLHPWSGDDDAREGEGESGGKEKDKRKVASAVACSPAQRQWASAGVNGTVTIWGLPT